MVIKKQYVIDNLPDFPVRKGAGGMYALLPYERLDKEGKAVFKVGQAHDFRKRFEQYHTYYPIGFYIKSLLSEPDEERENFWYRDPDDRNKRKFARKKYFNEIEKFIHEDIIDHGGEQVFSTTRVKNAKEEDGVLKGQTEWFYASPRTIDDSFKDAYTIYGGKNYSAHLKNINRAADRKSKGPTYTAEIHYKIYS